jgi:hypothetical protein
VGLVFRSAHAGTDQGTVLTSNVRRHRWLGWLRQGFPQSARDRWEESGRQCRHLEARAVPRFLFSSDFFFFRLSTKIVKGIANGFSQPRCGQAGGEECISGSPDDAYPRLSVRQCFLLIRQTFHPFHPALLNCPKGRRAKQDRPALVQMDFKSTLLNPASHEVMNK